MEQENNWIDCAVNPAYEISTVYPYRIRDKATKKLVREWTGKGRFGHGYLLCHLGKKKWLKHRIVAIQYIPNPNHLPQVDHIDGCRTNNHINNLRWTSRSENLKNKSTYNGKPFVYVEQMPLSATPLSCYNKHRLENLYVDRATKKLYLFNGVRIRELEPVRVNGRSANYYQVIDGEGKHCKLCHNKLFREDTDIEEESVEETVIENTDIED